MKNILVALGLLVTAGVFAQETAKKTLLDIEQHVFEKKFSKKWAKEKQSDWEKSVHEAGSIEELNKLFNEYSDLLAQSTSFSMGNSSATTEIEFVNYMMEAEGVLTDELVKDWSAEARGNWRKEIKDFVAKEEEKKKKMDQMARFQMMTAIVKDFTKKFPELWEDSKKNAFQNSTSVSLTGGSEIGISKDEYEVASFTVVYDTEGDEQLAKKLSEELMEVIKSNVGEGYKPGNEMDTDFVSSMKKVYQFEGEKFSETAKKPTVTIGVLKATPGVKVVITEPVFGH